MSTLEKRRLKARAELASAAASAARHPNDDARARLVDERRRAYRAVAAEVYIRELVDAAPPLSDEQRARLAQILRGAPC